MADAIQKQGQSVDAVADQDRQQHLEDAKLAYEILSDQEQLIDSDRLDFAETLFALAGTDAGTEDRTIASGLIDRIDVDSLTSPERTRYDRLRNAMSL